MRKLLMAVSVALLAVGVVFAEDFGGIVKKVDGNKVTVQKFKKGEKGDEVTLNAIDSVKVNKGRFNKETKKFEVGEAIEGGLKSVKEGAFVRVTTDNDNKITAIVVSEGKKKKE